MIFYAFLTGSTEEELANVKLESGFEKYRMLNSGTVSDKNRAFFAMIWSLFREYFDEIEYDTISRLLSAILKLGNMRNSIKESKLLFNDVHKVLKFKSSELFSFLMMNKKGMVLQTAEFVERVESLMETMYGTLINYVSNTINLNKFYTQNPTIPSRNAIHIVDMSGFQDLGMYGNEMQKKPNNFEEFSANYFYETFVNFFNDNRFGNLEKFKEEEIEEFFIETNYLENKETLKDFLTMERELLKMDEYSNFKDSVSKNLKIFQSDVFDRLNPDNSNTKSEDRNDLVSIQHSFSQFYNYNLLDIFTKNAFKHFKGIKSLFAESFLLEKLPAFNPSFKKSRISRQRHDQVCLFEGLNNSGLWFFYCMKIPKTESLSERSHAVFNQVYNFDFDSLILHHKKDFPYKIIYRFFIEKFNITTKIEQIRPDLNIDFRKLVRSILNHAFGGDRPDLYICGKTYLFVRDGFYDQINSMLKDSLPRSRLLIFVEQVLKDLLATHVDNSNAVIKLAQKFLLDNCVNNRFQCILKSKEDFVALWRRWKKNKEDTFLVKLILDEILDNLEYYNLKKVIRIQSIWRGRMVRTKTHKEESEKIGAIFFHNRARKIENKIKKTLEGLFNNRTIIDKINHEQALVRTGVVMVNNQITKLKLAKSRKIIGNFLKNYTIRQRIRDIRILRFKEHHAAKKILKFMRSTHLRIAKYYLDIDKDHKLQTKAQNSRVVEFEKNLKSDFRKLNLVELPATSLLNAKDEVGKVKSNFNLQVFAINLLEKTLDSPSILSRNISLGLASSYKEELFKIELTDEEILFLSEKQKLIIQKINAKKQLELKLPMKVDKVTYFEDSFLYVEETGIMKSQYLSFEAPEPEFDLEDDEANESIFEFTKVNGFCSRSQSIAGFTACRKVFYKSDFFKDSDIPKVFQMKRQITQIALGIRFMILLDESGIIYSVGENSFGQLGHGNSKAATRIQMIKSLVDAKEIVKSIAVGESHCLALTANNRVYGWGDNTWYQISAKSKNYRLRFFKPIDITQEIKPETGVKLQIYCGKSSSYIFSSNMKLFSLGRTKANVHNVTYEHKKIMQNIPKGTCIVGLDVRWNDYVEIISLKVIDYRNSSFDKVAFMTTANASLFDHFMRFNNSTLFPYTDVFAKYLSLGILNSKLTDLKNKAENQKYDKMIENMMFIK